MGQRGNPLTLEPVQSGRVSSKAGRAPPIERHDKGSRTRLALKDASAIPAFGAKNNSFTFTLSFHINTMGKRGTKLS